MSEDGYSQGHLKRLSDREHVRKRPGMYIGGLEEFGRLNLLMILLDDALVQVLAGEVSNIWIEVCSDGSWIFSNDGQGVPVIKNEDASIEMDRDISVAEAAIGCLRYGSFERERYQGRAGMLGVGVAVANFLSDFFVLETKTDDGTLQLKYSKGNLIESSTEIEAGAWSISSGTKFVFKPDPEMFCGEFIDERALYKVLPDSALLFRGVTIHFSSKMTNTEAEFSSPDGISGFFKEAEADQGEFSLPHLISAVSGPEFGWNDRNWFQYEKAEVVFRFVEPGKSSTQSFCNGYRTSRHGTHVEGFRKGLLEMLRELGRNTNRSLDHFEDSRILLHIDAVVSVFLNQPQFSSHERHELRNQDLVAQFSDLAKQALATYFAKEPDQQAKVLDRLIG